MSDPPATLSLFSSRATLSAECRRMMALAWPVVLTHLNWSLMSVIDVMFVGQVSTAELGALAAGRVINWIFIVTGMSALTGVLVYSAQADGAGDLPRTGAMFRQGLLLAVLIALFGFGIMTAAPAPLLGLLGVAPDLTGPGAEVVFAYALGLPGLMILCAGSYFLEGISRPQRVMAVNLLILPLNILLDWLLTGGEWGFPALGARGAALATAISVTTGGVLILWFSWRLPQAGPRGVRSLRKADWLAAWRDMPKLARFGLMPAVSAGLELAGFTYLIVLSTQMGLIQTAALQVIMSLHTLTFALALGLASAAGVRVGNAVGAKERDQALPRTLLAAALSMAVMALPILIFLIAPMGVVTMFSDDAPVRLLAGQLLFALAPFIFLDGLQAVGVSALRSLEDQVVAGVNGVIAFLIVLGGFAWWFKSLGMDAMGLIHAMQISLVVVVILQFGRLYQINRRPG